MATIILHHYPLSPYSEKVRAMLGYADLAWNSAITREMPPRPVMELLAGGYRKIPVAQIGADIFCDSKSIASEIAQLSGKPELAPENCSAEAQALAEKVDGELFFASIATASSKTLFKTMINSFSWLDVARFMFDRIKMGLSSKIKMHNSRTARALVENHLSNLEQQLSAPFLFGETPIYTDFAVYHALWFIREVGCRNLINAYPRVTAWMDRIKAFGDGKRTEITAAQAVEIATNSQPRPISVAFLNSSRLGKRVKIVPADYGFVPTEGTLVGESPSEWIIERTVKGLGAVNVYFPKQGFELMGA